MKLYRVNALLLKYFYISKNRIDRIFDILYWPLIDIFIWGFASYYIYSLSNINILSIIFSAVILWVFVWRGSQDIAVFILEDYWSKNLYHLFSSPVKISEHITSILIFGFLRGIASFLVMSLVAFLFYKFNIFVIPILLLGISVFILSIFGWIMGLLVTSFIFRFGQRIQVLAWSIVWIIQPFSCVFYPFSALPTWAANIAQFLPPMYVFENLRAYLQHGTIQYSGILKAFGIEMVMLIGVLFFLGYSFKAAKRKGLLAKAD
jgi:ABC-2 type transport system permease protein